MKSEEGRGKEVKETVLMNVRIDMEKLEGHLERLEEGIRMVREEAAFLAWTINLNVEEEKEQKEDE